MACLVFWRLFGVLPKKRETFTIVLRCSVLVRLNASTSLATVRGQPIDSGTSVLSSKLTTPSRSHVAHTNWRVTGSVEFSE